MSDLKTIAASYWRCTCTDQQPVAALPCGCIKCATCGAFIEWAHNDSL